MNIPSQFRKGASELEVDTKAGEFDDPVVYINPAEAL